MPYSWNEEVRFANARSWFSAGAESPGEIDEGTWDGLGGDALFKGIDTAASSLGSARLYEMLRRPPRETDESLARRASIDALLGRGGSCGEGRGSAGGKGYDSIFEALGNSRGICVRSFVTLLDGGEKGGNPAVFRILGAAALLAMLAIPVFGEAAVLPFLAVMVLNFVVHFAAAKRIEMDSGSLWYLHKSLRAAKRIVRRNSGEFPGEAERLRALLPDLARLERLSARFSPPASLAADLLETFAQYIKILFLLEAAAYAEALRECLRARAQILESLDLTGKIEALCAVARWASAKGGTAVPEFLDEATLECVDVVHPLLEGAVANSVAARGRGIVITGTNMSGKSTFLRTLGLNQILVLAFGLAFAKSWRGAAFIPICSMSIRDDLASGMSKYGAEAMRLLEILRISGLAPGDRGEHARQAGRPSLVLIDEILSGTNSTERREAAVAILKAFAGSSSLVIAATHDVEIGLGLADSYDNHHFADEVSAEGLSFDFRLKPGVVKTRNAVRLLRFLGYPDSVLEGLEKAMS